MGAFENYRQLKEQMKPLLVPSAQVAPMTPQEAGIKQPATETVQPQVDTSENTMKSLAQMLGPTPQEYEEQQRQARNHRDQMMKWTALVDGMRNLANLYYTARGANPQHYTDSPYAGVEQRYQQDLKENAANAEYRRSYGKALWDMQQKINANERAAALQNAQIQWYGARGEMAQQKAELEKLKAVRVVKQKDGSLWKFDPVSGELDQLKESDPLYSKYVQSQIDKNNRMGYGRSGSGGTGKSGKDNGTYGYKIVEYIDDAGRKVKERIPTTGNSPNKAPVSQRERTVTTKEPKKKSAPQPDRKKSQPTNRTSEKRKSKTSI